MQTVSCLQGGPLTVQSTTAASSSGLISSMTSYEHGVGDSGCPWVIEAFPGQRINLTLMDFTEYGGPSTSSEQQNPGDVVDLSRRFCRELAVVEETTALKNLVTCSHQPRTNVVFVSKTNRIKITFSARDLDEDQPPHFVIKYDGRLIGRQCPRYSPNGGCNRNRNRKPEVSATLKKAKSREPAFTGAYPKQNR